MNPNRVRVGQVWRERSTGRVCEVLFVEPDRQLNVGVKIRNVETGRVTWCAAWRISAYWRLLSEARAA